MLVSTVVALLFAASFPVDGARGDPAAAARVVGHWEGAFSRLGSVQRAEIDLRLEDGALAGTFRIGELGLAGEPLRDVEVTDSTVTFALLYGRFEMRIDSAAEELTGSNPRWNPVVDLHLKRALPEIVYDTETVRVGAAGATIAGMLYLPRRRGPAPLVVVAGGSEQTTRAQWEYRSWGDVLARHGIAAFVYDRRGHGASTGDSAHADLRDESADVVAMVDALARRPDIDRRRIAVLGTSRGGWVAPLAAAASREITVLLLECAPAVGVIEQELQRISHVEPDDSVSAGDIVQAAAYERFWLGAARGGAPWSVIDSASVAARAARWRSIAVIPDSAADVAWWVRNDFDQQALLRRIHIPVVAVFGAEDRTVPLAENLEPMRAALAAGGNREVTIRVIPEAGHGLWLFGRLRGGEWKWPAAYWRWARKAPGAFEAVITAMADGGPTSHRAGGLRQNGP
ncbi:alpha/beta hydrolase [Longimicrobium sp.]|uniref:alpha/beta hydrolase family protein n=1 Tax=Longimicrobium sp. TaxID=2029185 RepID=UPI002B70F04B|nr:alpha/beta hydrolase [Longimicrobium sp.]HSU14094.1 alpha/beta hydrolase [Longimicrobium sp.]